MAGLKCVTLSSDEDRLLVDAAVQEAQEQGAMVGPGDQPRVALINLKCTIGPLIFFLAYFRHLPLFSS